MLVSSGISLRSLVHSPRATAGLLALALLTAFLPACSTNAVVVRDQLKLEGRNDFYAGNRAPLLPSPLIKLPVGAVEPRGWLRGQLELEAEGMIGHMTELSRWCNFDESAWVTPDGSGKWAWEEMPYWLKGYVDLAYVLKDPHHMAEAKRWIDSIIASQRSDGTFGPKGNFEKNDLWPHMCVLYALRSYYEATGDPRVIYLMTRYFQYVQRIPADRLFAWDRAYSSGWWQWIRGGDQLDSMYWLYNRTGDSWLLDLAKINHSRTADWTSGIPNWHGVNIAEGFREPGQYYVQSHDPKHLAAAERNYDEVRERFGQVPGGMFGSDENCREGFSGPRQGTETCSFVEMMHSDELLLKVSGDGVWADRCEEIAFNSLPAALTPDLKALRYLTCPNHIQSDRANKAPLIENDGDMLSYSPYEQYRCCQHNVAFGWPYFAEHLWMATPGNGLAAAMYAPSRVIAKVGDGTEVTIDEQTDYPFDEKIALSIHSSKPVKFPLKLRVPGWCEKASIRVNDEATRFVKPGWAILDREWHDGDKIRIALPMEIRTRFWEKNADTVSVERGPLTYSLEIGEDWREYDNGRPWAAFEVFPGTPWNFGLVLDRKHPADSFEFVQTDRPVGRQPFTPAAAPLEIKAKGRRIPQWRQEQNGLVGAVQESPVRSDEPVQDITLIPMGCARLRITAFPWIGDGPGAHEWKELPPPQALIASHCFARDSVHAVADERLPKNSNDPTTPRFTWWDHRGTKEWIAWAFNEPRRIGFCEVYWYDDTGAGECRVPRSWTLEYRPAAGEAWQSIQADSFGVARDRFNRVTFDPVEAVAVRIRVELQSGFSGGILEWRLGE